MSRRATGCAVCEARDHDVRSCEDPRAVAYWRRRATTLRTAPGAGSLHAGLADKCDAKAAALERRLSGVSRASSGRARLP